MTKAEGGRWDLARRQLVGRWRLILERIEAHDEGGVLQLSTEMDEFCDEAELQRRAAAGEEGLPYTGPTRAEMRLHESKIPREAGMAGSRCLFCQGFVELGGCLGIVGEVNQAVLQGRWPEARRLAERYLARLESMELAGPGFYLVH